jgi:hypothetical protein
VPGPGLTHAGGGRDDGAVLDRTPGEGRYARVEREQRWVLADIPPDAVRLCEIVDRYLVGTRLRLRRMDDGERVVHKLAQKVRPEPVSPEVVRLTNIYLTEAEYDALLPLPAAELRKVRWTVTWDGRAVAVDQHLDRRAGLILAETELDATEPRLPTPPFAPAAADVTDDDRFSGGALAFADDGDIAALLAEVRTRR